jgi:hypothetical protein
MIVNTSETEFQVTSETVGGAGCGCSGMDGAGTYTYQYESAESLDYAGNRGDSAYFYQGTLSPNTWVERITETMPDSAEGDPDQIVTYTNEAGEVMMNVAISGDLADVTYYQYDENGRLVMTVEPSAISQTYDPSDPSAFEEYPDLVGSGYAPNGAEVYGSYANISPDSGLIELTDYGQATTATSGGTGDVLGYVKDTKIQQGYLGTPVLQSALAYTEQTAATGGTIYPLASSIIYRNTDGTGAEATNYSYTFYSATDRIKSMTVNAPVIDASQNGPGTSDTTDVFYDTYGRAVWTMDGNGTIGYTAYDPATGAAIQTIQDVNTGDLSDLQNDAVSLPYGWSTPDGGGLNLATSYQVDSLGRTVQETDPNGDTTYTVYDDTDDAVFTFPGGSESLDEDGNGTLETTGPIRMTRTQVPYSFVSDGDTLWGTYDETLAFSGTVTVTDGAISPRGDTLGDGKIIKDRSLPGGIVLEKVEQCSEQRLFGSSPYLSAAIRRATSNYLTPYFRAT